MTLRHWLPAALALAALGVAGCGGGDGDDTTAPPAAPEPSATTLSKEELISQGDAICAEVNAAVGTVAASDTDATGRVAQEAALYSGMVERLKDLGTPEDEAGHREFIDAAEQLAQAESDAQLAAERGDGAGLETAESEVSSALASFQSAAQAYGFEECGEAPSAPTPAGAASPGESESAEGVEEEAEAAPEEAEAEPAPETGGAGSTEAGGGAAGGGEGAAPEGSGGTGSGGIGPG